jgi:hypothetical protein
MCVQFGFVIFWQKDFGTKAAHKTLVKLTPGVSGPTNIRLGCQCLTVTNTPAYQTMMLITILKSLRKQAPEACIIKLITAVINSIA